MSWYLICWPHKRWVKMKISICLKYLHFKLSKHARTHLHYIRTHTWKHILVAFMSCLGCSSLLHCFPLTRQFDTEFSINWGQTHLKRTQVIVFLPRPPLLTYLSSLLFTPSTPEALFRLSLNKLVKIYHISMENCCDEKRISQQGYKANSTKQM